MNQPNLFCNTRFDEWATFHTENPQVFALFRKFALEAYQANRGHFGARIIGERIRWYTTVETNTQSPKINDHHWPYYARLLAGTDERFASWFTFKDKRFDATIGEIVAVHRRAAA